MIIDHIGIVVSSIKDSIIYWEKVFHYEQYTDIVINTRQKVKVVFMSKENSLLIKLIEPINEESSIYQFSKKGVGLHHLCFKCDDMNQQIKELNDNRVRTITKPEPGEAFEEENIAFLYSNQNFYIELIDTNKKASIINDNLISE